MQEFHFVYFFGQTFEIFCLIPDKNLRRCPITFFIKNIAFIPNVFIQVALHVWKGIFLILQKALIRRGSIINEINQCSHLEWSFLLLLLHLLSFILVESANFRNWIIMEMIIISRRSDSLSFLFLYNLYGWSCCIILLCTALHTTQYGALGNFSNLFILFLFAKPVRSEVEGEQEVMKEKKIQLREVYASS